MTPEEFAALHGLTVEEAELILARRNQKAAPVGGRLALALKALSEAVRKTGVAPVRIGQGGFLEKSEVLDPEALEKFYANKGGHKWREEVQGEWVDDARPMKRKVRQPVVAAEDESQDPEDYG